MTTAHTFALAWILGWTLLVLPLSIALLCGWASAWVRRRATPRMLRMRGIGGLILWASAVTSAVLLSAGVYGDRYYLGVLVGPVAVLAAIVLVAVTDVAERRRGRVPFPTSQ
ncbi:hypothetical protein ACFWFI_09065 [Streptomyces sp. NPDC060209]|uniref:hypothetical protein n=1 Tax=Streptomyces sp. NPDC060209 TaxID=3347073 RepID=UPI00366971FB